MNLKNTLSNTLGENTFLNIKELVERFSPKARHLVLKRKLFYQTFVNKNDLCYDVGANIGNRITPLLQIGANVIAIEPQESCLKILSFKFGNRIKIVTKGLCEKQCIRKFHISNANTISSFSEEWINLVKNNRFKENKWDKTVDIEMTTLDNLIEEYGIPIYIKIDVEGYELEVLKGLSKPIKMISFEYTVPEQLDKISACIDVLVINSPNILCNFSIGESMKWALPNWLTVKDFYKYINDSDFVRTGFGDIYIKQNYG